MSVWPNVINANTDCERAQRVLEPCIICGDLANITSECVSSQDVENYSVLYLSVKGLLVYIFTKD